MSQLTKKEQALLDKHRIQIEQEAKIKKEATYKNKIRELNSSVKKLTEGTELRDAIIDRLIQIKEAKKSDYIIKSTKSNKESETTAVINIADAHCDEVVRLKAVNYKNKYDFGIFEACIYELARVGLKLINIERSDTTIDNLVIAILGDLISGYIHEELEETNSMTPPQAVVKIFNTLVSFFDYLLAKGNFVKITVVEEVGNHARTTKKKRYKTKTENSYEYIIYSLLAEHYKDNGRITFIFEPSEITYLDIYKYTIGFLHGDNVHYQSGVGGVTIPLLRAIPRWNTNRQAYLYNLAHHHTYIPHGKFIMSGCIIGYNEFAASHGFEYEPPSQAFYLINRDLGLTVNRPIYFEKRV